MKKNFIYLFTVICIVYCSCVPSFKLGRYNGKNNSGNPNDFTFFEDSTFSYNYYGSIGKHSTGKYEIRDDKIILNSSVKDVFMPVQYSLLSLDSLRGKNRITVQFKVPEVRTQKDYKCILILNEDTLNYNKNAKDTVELYITQDIWVDDKWGAYTICYTEPLDSVKLEIWVSPFVVARPEEPVTTQTIYFNSALGKDIIFNIAIDESLFGYRVFDNVELAIKRNRIIFIDTEKDNAWRNMHIFKEERDNKNTLYLRRN